MATAGTSRCVMLRNISDWAVRRLSEKYFILFLRKRQGKGSYPFYLSVRCGCISGRGITNIRIRLKYLVQ